MVIYIYFLSVKLNLVLFTFNLTYNLFNLIIFWINIKILHFWDYGNLKLIHSCLIFIYVDLKIFWWHFEKSLICQHYLMY